MKRILVLSFLIFSIAFLFTNCSKNELQTRQIDAVLGVGESNIVSAVYPNPASDVIIINSLGIEHISIIDCYGQLLRDIEVTGDECIIDIHEYPSGLYILRVFTENGTCDINIAKI